LRREIDEMPLLVLIAAVLVVVALAVSMCLGGEFVLIDIAHRHG
jgi:hypothetical protein